MSLSKRLYDLARANLGSLFERKNDGELEVFSDEELEAELVLRRDRRRRQDAARAATEAAERAARERNQRRAAAAAQRNAQGARPQGATSTKAGTQTGAGPRSTSRPPPTTTPERQARAALYAILETPDGADFETVKKNFRRLMRKHHPDLAGGSAEKQRLANEVTQTLTVAYNELERRLTRKIP